jgi:hypothetical protein
MKPCYWEYSYERRDDGVILERNIKATKRHACFGSLDIEGVEPRQNITLPDMMWRLRFAHRWK